MQIYYQPHKSRKKEAAFVESLISHFQVDEIITRNYPIPALSGKLDIAAIRQSLATQNLTKRKWLLLLAQLQALPDMISVFRAPSEISCDVVVVKDGQPYFIEYHEKQHRNLSVDRPTSLYDIDGTAIIVPRYVQRYLRDIWRIQRLHPFTIFWDDKFCQDGLAGFSLQTDRNCVELCASGHLGLANFAD